MQKSKARYAVLLLVATAYATIGYGGWMHPAEVNVASYILWLTLASMLVYSSRAQGFDGEVLPLGFTFGNASMIILGIYQGGYTFNLGLSETIVLYGLIITAGFWIITGQATGSWNPRILFLGGVGSDILSFYPQLKQYLLPHEPPTIWLLCGWGLWLVATVVTILFIEELPRKLRMTKQEYQREYTEPKSIVKILEASAFTLENGLFMLVTIVVMGR